MDSDCRLGPSCDAPCRPIRTPGYNGLTHAAFKVDYPPIAYHGRLTTTQAAADTQEASTWPIYFAMTGGWRPSLLLECPLPSRVRQNRCNHFSYASMRECFGGRLYMNRRIPGKLHWDSRTHNLPPLILTSQLWLSWL